MVEFFGSDLYPCPPIPQEQYIIDTDGNKTAVILSIDRYQQLLPISDLDPEFQEL